MNVWMRCSYVVAGVNIGSPCLDAGERMGAKGISSSAETYLWINVSEHLREGQTVRSARTQHTLLLCSNIQGHKILPVSNVKRVFNQRGRCPGDVAKKWNLGLNLQATR